jgi:hypothetical protein
MRWWELVLIIAITAAFAGFISGLFPELLERMHKT